MMRRVKYPINEIWGIDDFLFYLIVWAVVSLVTYFTARNKVFTDDTDTIETETVDQDDYSLSQGNPETGDPGESWPEKKAREEKEKKQNKNNRR